MAETGAEAPRAVGLPRLCEFETAGRTMSEGMSLGRQELAQSISEHVEQHLESLPLLPIVVARMLALRIDDEDYFEKVLTLAEEDPTFALRLIRLSNSPVMAPTVPVTTLRMAIARVGASHIAGLITSLAVIRVFVPRSQDERDLWVHAIQVAVGARELARELMLPGTDAEEMYLYGLLHDIGRFVMFDLVPDALRKVADYGWKSPEELVAAELKICGVDHAELGGRVCERWGLPRPVVEAVREHHHLDRGLHHSQDPAGGAQHATDLNSLRLIYVADHLSVAVLMNPDAGSSSRKTLMEALEPIIQSEVLLEEAGVDGPEWFEAIEACLPRISEASAAMITALSL